VLRGLGAMGLAASVARPSLAAWFQPGSGAESGVSPLVTAPAQTSAPRSLFHIGRVTESVYAAVAKPAALINCNAAIIVNADHVLVVDTHSKPSAARALIEQIRAEVSNRPVRYVVNTHFHWDHAQGNLAYPNAFGASTEVIASTTTREWLAREGAPRLRQSLEELPPQIAGLKAQLAAARNAAAREALSARIAEMEAYLQEMNPPPITLPTITFSERLALHRGGREIHLIFLGRGHTAGDIIVYLPSERVVVTGDLMQGLLPFMGDGYPDEWPRTITALEELDFTRVVPGHGSVQQDKSVLAFFRAYISEINEAVARGVERGASLEELQRALPPDRLRSLGAPDQLARLEREAKALLGPVADVTVVLKAQVAANLAETYNFYTKRRGRG
jgi:cyclase